MHITVKAHIAVELVVLLGLYYSGELCALNI